MAAFRSVPRSAARWLVIVPILGTVVVFAAMSLGPKAAETGTVSGVVTINGVPLPDATVTFTPGEGPASTARTDAQGRFTLAHAVVGRHTVRVTDDSDSSALAGTTMDSGEPVMRDILPGDNHDLVVDLHTTIEQFSGRLTHEGNPVEFDPNTPLMVQTIHRDTGQWYGVPISPDGTFAIGRMPTGRYSAALARRDMPGPRVFPGMPGTHMIPEGVTLVPDKSDYEIELGPDWSPKRLFRPGPPSKRPHMAVQAGRG